MKKGFTLIELLAVIVILAIIALIATPQILNIIADSRVSSNKISANNYVKGLETKIAIDKMNKDFNPNICIYEKGITTCDGKEIKVEFEGNIEYAIVTFKNNKVDYYAVYFSDGEQVESEGLEQDFLYTYVYDAPVTYSVSNNCISAYINAVEEVSQQDAQDFCNLSLNEMLTTLFGTAEEPIRTAGINMLVAKGALEQHSDGNKIGVSIVGTDNPNVTVVIPSKINNLPVIKIDSLAFLQKYMIKNIIISNTVEEIGIGAFNNNPLEKVIIGNPVSGSNITNIDNLAFYPGKYKDEENNDIIYSDDIDVIIYADSSNVTLEGGAFGFNPNIAWLPIGQ